MAGVPASTAPFSVQLRLTVALAPIVTLSAMVIAPKMTALGPIYTLSPICGAAWLPLLAPMLTQACSRQFLPTRAAGLTIIVP